MKWNKSLFFREEEKKSVFRDQRGITLLEILMVVTLIGVLSAVAIPNYSRWAENRIITAESNKLYLNLLLARSTAIKNNNDAIFTFNAGANSYQIHDDTNSDGVEDAGETIKIIPQDPRIQFGFVGGTITDIDGNAVNTSVALVGGGSVITFSSNGQASTGGSAFLIHGTDAGSSNDRVRSVSIVEATGAVDLWKFDSGLTPPWS